jgi:hypothetical protein
VLRKTSRASGQNCRIASSTFAVPSAFTSKSTSGISFALSCDGCAAQNRVEAVLLEKREDSLALAYIEIAGFKPRRGLLQPRQIPAGVARSAKKLAPHIVVYADDRVPCRSKYSAASEPISPLLPVISVVIMPKE